MFQRRVFFGASHAIHLPLVTNRRVGTSPCAYFINDVSGVCFSAFLYKGTKVMKLCREGTECYSCCEGFISLCKLWGALKSFKADTYFNSFAYVSSRSSSADEDNENGIFKKLSSCCRENSASFHFRLFFRPFYHLFLNWFVFFHHVHLSN